VWGKPKNRKTAIRAVAHTHLTHPKEYFLWGDKNLANKIQNM